MMDLRNITEPNDTLWEADINLFASMKDHYQSANERTFFEMMEQKETWQFAFGVDDLMVYEDNEEGFRITRCAFDIYALDVKGMKFNRNTQMIMTLSAFLNLHLKNDASISSLDMTLWEWLRQRDYKGIHYDRNRYIE